MLQATNSVGEPQVGRRRRWPCPQNVVERGLFLAGARRGEEVEVVSDGVVRQMEPANAEAAFGDSRAHEVLVSFVGFRLRRITYTAEIQLAYFPAKAILRGQILTDWRTGAADVYVIARAQMVGEHAWCHDIPAAGGASDCRAVRAETADAQEVPGWARVIDSLDVCFGHERPLIDQPVASDQNGTFRKRFPQSFGVGNGEIQLGIGNVINLRLRGSILSKRVGEVHVRFRDGRTIFECGSQCGIVLQPRCAGGSAPQAGQTT